MLNLITDMSTPNRLEQGAQDILCILDGKTQDYESQGTGLHRKVALLDLPMFLLS
jgi:hypothetical protein